MSPKRTRRTFHILIIVGVVAILYPIFFNHKISAGDKLPSFTVYDQSGNAVDSGDFPSKVLIIHFWGQWCDVCLPEMYQLKELQESSPYVAVIAIHEGATGEDLMAVQNILDEGKFNYSVFMDRFLYGEKLFGIKTVPATFLVDKNGVIVKKLYGPQNWSGAKIRRLLERLVDPPFGKGG